TIHQIDDTLDISLIEGLGKQLLFKAIQSRNLTAFAGTGLSISYGRLGWRAWQTEQQRIARANANSFIKLSEAALELMRYLHDLVQPKNEFPDKDDKSLFETDPDFPELWKKVNKEGPGTLADEKFTNKHWEKTDLKPVVSPKHWGQPQRHNVWRWLRSRQSQHDFALRQIEGLFQTFKKTQDGEGQFPGGEEMPVKFEVAQQLHTELHQHVSLFLPMLNSGDQHDEKREQERKEDAWFGSRATTGNGAPLGALYVLKWFLTKRHGLKDKLKELHEEYEKRFEDFSTRMNRAEARLSFETLAKVLLVDECPHAALHLREGVLQGQDPDDEKLDKELRKAYTEWLEVEDELKVFTTDNLKRNPDGIRKRRERYKVLTPFKLENFEALMEKTAPGEGNPWQHLHNVITTALAHYRATKGERNYLSPSARFMVAAYLARRDDAVDWLTREEKKDLQSPFRTDFMNRSSLMDRQQDPLHKAVTDLGVRHYVTTNYDFEIERFFEDSGYRRFPATIREPNERNKPPSVDDFRADDIGGVLKDQSFSQDMAADMVTFAVNQQSHDASVYHLHGRATKEDNLVITERDYMELYLSSGPKRDTADEGISLIFSGVPLLFLGLGMNETDLLRPLRQFISNRDRTIGYTSIALLPADSGIDARTKFSSALYLRYGVHTIFYGSGTMRVQGMHSNTGELFSVPDQDKNDRADRRGLDWMHRILKLIGALKEVTKAYIGDEGKTANEFTSEAQIYEFIRKQVGQVQDDLADKDIGYEADGWALETLLGVRYELAPDLPKRDDFETDKAYGDAANAHHKAWDKELVDRLTDQVPNESEEDKGRTIRIAHCDFTPTRPKNAPNPHSDDEPPVNSKEYLEDECAMLTELLAMTLKLPVTSRCPGLEKDRDLRARVIFLNGLDGAIRTGCMNAAIAAITKEQRQWWQRFQQSPPHRVARFQELPHQPDPHTRHEPRRYVRHNVDGVITNLEELDKPVDLRRQPIRDREDPGRINQHPDVATRVRTFDTFIAAVDANFSRRHLSPNRRVLITVAALRGTGKGTFLSAFSSRRGLALYAKAAWGNYPYVQLSGAIFINLSFATEIGSVFDMLINAINAEALQFDPQPDSEEVKEIKKHTSLTSEEREEKIAYVQSVEHDKRVKNEIDEQEVGVSRLRRLRSAIKRYTDASNNAAEHGWQ
ncbi:MAG: SIR2 family protein, partial [Pseudomonadota bacterium]